MVSSLNFPADYMFTTKPGIYTRIRYHSVKEYVNGQAHTNGIESFGALLKCGYYGTHHQMSAKHLHRYIDEFAWRHNIREQATADQMAFLAERMAGKRLPYRELIA